MNPILFVLRLSNRRKYLLVLTLIFSFYIKMKYFKQYARFGKPTLFASDLHGTFGPTGKSTHDAPLSPMY